MLLNLQLNQQPTSSPQVMSLGITLSKAYQGPMEIADYMRKAKSQYSLGKVLSSHNKRYFVLDLNYMQFYYLPKKDAHYADSHQIFLGEISKVSYDHHQVLNDDKVWKYGIIISARKKDYHLLSQSREFIDALLFAFSHLIDSSTQTPLFNWENYQKQVKKLETKQFSFNPQGTITFNQQQVDNSTTTKPFAFQPEWLLKEEAPSSNKSLEVASQRASDETSTPSSQTEDKGEITSASNHENIISKLPGSIEIPEEQPQNHTIEPEPVREKVEVLKVDSASGLGKVDDNLSRLRNASRNRGRNNSMRLSQNQEITNFIKNELIQNQQPDHIKFSGINQINVQQAKPQEKTNNIWESTTNPRARYPSLGARQKVQVAHQRAKLLSYRGSGISIESPQLVKQSDRADSSTPETNNSSPPKSSCDDDQLPTNNKKLSVDEDWDKELFRDDSQVTKKLSKPPVSQESYNFRPAVPIHNDWDDELDL